MAFLFGDSKSFPLDENFIETMRDAIGVCFLLLRADEVIEEIREQTVVEKKQAEQDIDGMRTVLADLTLALESHIASGVTPAVTEVASRSLQSLRDILESAQRSRIKRRDAWLVDAESRIKLERSHSPQILEKLLQKHELSQTGWNVSWTAWQSNAPADASAAAEASTPAGLVVSFKLDLSSLPIWTKPIRVDEIRAGLVLKLPKKGKGSKSRDVELDRYYISEVKMTSRGSALVLRRALKQSSPGLDVQIQPGQQSRTTVTPVDDPSVPAEVIVCDGPQASLLQELWGKVAVQLKALVTHRSKLVEARLENTPVGELKTPAELARMIIKDIAPLVREIHSRSLVEGELTLKREVKEGRREELFISVHELTSIYEPLKPKRRALFDELGLEKKVAEEKQSQHSHVVCDEQIIDVASDEEHCHEIEAPPPSGGEVMGSLFEEEEDENEVVDQAPSDGAAVHGGAIDSAWIDEESLDSSAIDEQLFGKEAVPKVTPPPREEPEDAPSLAELVKGKGGAESE